MSTRERPPRNSDNSGPTAAHLTTAIVIAALIPAEARAMEAHLMAMEVQMAETAVRNRRHGGRIMIGPMKAKRLKLK